MTAILVIFVEVLELQMWSQTPLHNPALSLGAAPTLPVGLPPCGLCQGCLTTPVIRKG